MGKRSLWEKEQKIKKLEENIKKMKREMEKEKKRRDSVASCRPPSLDRSSDLSLSALDASTDASTDANCHSLYSANVIVYAEASGSSVKSEMSPSLPEKATSVDREMSALPIIVCANSGTKKAASLTDQTNMLASTSSAPEEGDLDENDLRYFSQRIPLKRTLAQPIHKDVVTYIDRILKEGLLAEEKQQLIQKFHPPKNCLIIDPPKLNLEVKDDLQEEVTEKDSSIARKQTCITAVIAGLVSLLSTILKLNVNEKSSMIETLRGVIGLISDLQRDESSIRRDLIMKNINTSWRDTFASTVPDEWLFGQDLKEKLKAAERREVCSRKIKSRKSIPSATESSKHSSPCVQDFPQDKSWDPEKVLSLFRRWGSTENLSLEQLSYKLVTLVILITDFNRMKDLMFINYKNITCEENHVKIKIRDSQEKSGVQSNIIIPFYKEETVCIASTLKYYLKRSLAVRGSEEKLLVSFKPPHKVVTPQMLGILVKKMLYDSTIDVSSFNANMEGQVRINTILQFARWKSGSTFEQFYKRNIKWP
ncbi:uncharacterized protein LOC116841923 [Odontomachus brunneus]|uniref:uncharacterized protein LOC116841923 n=1 Tax=Odontomachus brunneus TaxID=486640 RepID=UPI0013F20860|nr:uncharacterized protein LOC116841923 [Odontomachus brunneus]